MGAGIRLRRCAPAFQISPCLWLGPLCFEHWIACGRVARHIARVFAQRCAPAGAVTEIVKLHDGALPRIETGLARTP